jgi:hypothetical protein
VSGWTAQVHKLTVDLDIARQEIARTQGTVAAQRLELEAGSREQNAATAARSTDTNLWERRLAEAQSAEATLRRQVSEAQAEEATLRRQVAALEASQLAAESAQRKGEAGAAADADLKVAVAVRQLSASSQMVDQLESKVGAMQIRLDQAASLEKTMAAQVEQLRCL